MDVETSEAIETLRGDIRRVERTVKGVASQVSEIKAKLTTVDGKLSVFDAKLDELRVHGQVLNEAVRDDIQMVAEAVAALTAKGSTR